MLSRVIDSLLAVDSGPNCLSRPGKPFGPTLPAILT